MYQDEHVIFRGSFRKFVEREIVPHIPSNATVFMN